jgi:hypothetical protein
MYGRLLSSIVTWLRSLTSQRPELCTNGTAKAASNKHSSSLASSLLKCVAAQPCQRAIHFGRSSVTHRRNAVRRYSQASAGLMCNDDGGESNRKSSGGEFGGEAGGESHGCAASRIA